MQQYKIIFVTLHTAPPLTAAGTEGGEVGGTAKINNIHLLYMLSHDGICLVCRDDFIYKYAFLVNGSLTSEWMIKQKDTVLQEGRKHIIIFKKLIK